MQTIAELIKTIESNIEDKKINNALELLSPFEEYIGEDWQTHFEPGLNEFKASVLHKDNHFKLLLIHWNEKSKSGKHGHLEGGGLMRVLNGEINETRFHPDDAEQTIGEFKYTEGDLCYIHDALGFHVVENKEQTPAISLHLYCNGV